MNGRIIAGDAQNELGRLLDQSVDMCVTSPPYYMLRNYGVDGQIGLEQTIDEYINKLVYVFNEVKRVLKDSGTLWVNISDSYAGSGKNSGSKTPCAKMRKELQHLGDDLPKTQTSIPNKNLLLIPQRFIIALQDNGWIVRQDIIWQKPNPMPESVRDRCTKSHEYIFLLAKTPRYYFNADAIKEPATGSTSRRWEQPSAVRYAGNKYTADPNKFYRTKSGNAYKYRPYRNKRDVWTIATVPLKEAHFAAFPPTLAETCMLAGCPDGGTVLDPFFGAGTVGIAAERLKRNYIGIDINPEYCEIAKTRIEKEIRRTT